VRVVERDRSFPDSALTLAGREPLFSKLGRPPPVLRHVAALMRHLQILERVASPVGKAQ
jgi:hypothetical protein